MSSKTLSMMVDIMAFCLSPDTSRIPPQGSKSEDSQEDEANFVMMNWSIGKDVTGIFVKPPCGAALSRRWY